MKAKNVFFQSCASVAYPLGCDYQKKHPKVRATGRLILFIGLFILQILIQTASAQTWQATYAQADSLMQKRSFKEAIPLYEQALPMAEKEYGRNNEQYLNTRNGLGRSIIFIKTKEEIEPFLLENIALCKTYGEKTAIYAQALHNVGTFYLPIRIGNNQKKSEEYLKQALVLRKEVLGIKHLVLPFKAQI